MPRRSTGEIEELLRIARETLIDRVLPELDQEGRYAVRMVVNAMRITERSLNAGEPRKALMTDLKALYSDCDAATVEDSEALRRRFAADIRGGRFDGGELGQRVRRILHDDVERRLRISNPRYLRDIRDNV